MKDSTDAVQRAIDDLAGLPIDQAKVDDRHERGCILRYGAVPDNGSPFIEHPELCPCHRHARNPEYLSELGDDLAYARNVALNLSSRLQRMRSDNVLFMAALCAKNGGEFRLRHVDVLAAGANPTVDSYHDVLTGDQVFRLRNEP